MAQSKDCPKCGSHMARGFMVDHQHGGGKGIVRYYEGEPRRSFWLGLRLRGLPSHEITTWRCKRCSYLENYAG